MNDSRTLSDRSWLPKSPPTENVIAWLLAGDPSIRWQVLRDLLRADEKAIADERKKIAREGWGAQLLSYQDKSGRWGGQLYSNKWLSTTYSLQLLRQLGLEPANLQAHLGCRELLQSGFQLQGGISFARTTDTIDNGVTGMILSLLAYFGYPDERVNSIADYLLGQQLPDGRWEPVPGNQIIRYAFDTTILILEGLHEYEHMRPKQSDPIIAAQRNGREFLLRHKCYQSIHTGENLDRKITLFSFPLAGITTFWWRLTIFSNAG